MLTSHLRPYLIQDFFFFGFALSFLGSIPSSGLITAASLTPVLLLKVLVYPKSSWSAFFVRWFFKISVNIIYLCANEVCFLASDIPTSDVL